jgi:UDP-glucose 4-epimerase
MDLKGKRFLVIGGAGFIGSHTVDQLVQEDVAEIRVFDNFSRGRSENLSGALTDPRVKVFELGGDILHTDILEAAMRDIDGVFHFAALWLLHCHDFPRSAFQVNVAGMFNVLEACVKSGVKRLVYSSSASVYGDAVEEPMREDHPFNNKNFYGATKICGEAMARAMHHRFGLHYVGLRYMNVYGARQDYVGAYIAVIMKMLDAIDRGDGPTVQGDGTEAFDFVHVSDCARANVLAMKSDVTDIFLNVSTGVRTTLNELAQTLVQLTAVDRPIHHVPRPQAQLVRSRVGDPRLASDAIGFEARIGLREGLQELIAWRSANLARSTGAVPATAASCRGGSSG